mgnify:CR=1 FL=1
MGSSGRHLSKQEIIKITEECFNNHKTFGELGLKSDSHKGGLGNFVEKNVFNIEPNSDPHPDFIDAGIELKVTPLRSNNDGTLVSKERLVLNMIDYYEESKATFKTSSFYKKNQKLLIWFYRYLKGKPQTDFKLEAWEIFEFENSLEYKVIKRDWEIIHKKIVEGKAHEISESDTTFLAACTKGVNASSIRKQPNSNIPAKQRAYSFKNSFMTRLYRQLIHELAPYVSFISEDEWMKDPLEEVYKEKLSYYKGKSVNELKIRFKLGNSKQLTFNIAQRMLGLQGKDSSTVEMLDAGIKLKTVRLRKNGVPHEAMSFPAFDFTELINTKWEESEIREEFIDWKLMFFVFQDDENGVCRFDRVQFWNIPNSIVDGKIKHMYEDAAALIKNGEALTFENGKIVDRFAKEKRNGNGVCHIRPHGRNKKDTFKLPVVDKETKLSEYTKQSFWFNSNFVKEILKNDN